MDLFISSGDVIADRRFEFGRELEKRGDLAAAADLYAQAVEIAPGFASAWFALGTIRAKQGQGAAAVEAFGHAAAADPQDRHGAAVQRARLTGEAVPMPAAYVRTLFDQYAKHYDLSLLQGLEYRGPGLLFDAVAAACAALGRDLAFDRALDLGCGTGLASEPFAPHVASLAGIDISAAMIEQARRTGRYQDLHVCDIGEFLARQNAAAADLVIAADCLPYVSDLHPLAKAVATVLAAGGLFACTVETDAADGVVLRDTLRYAHGSAHVRAALAAAGLACVVLQAASSRKERNIPVPGLVVVAAKPASTPPVSAARAVG